MTDKLIAKARKPRVWEAMVPTTGYVEGPLLAWPAEMQDQVYQAMELIILRTGCQLELLQCICVHDELGYYANITVMEKLTAKDVVITHG